VCVTAEPAPDLSPVVQPGPNVEVETVLNFIAAIIDSVIWPAVVLLLLLMFRRQVVKIADAFAQRMSSLRRVKLPWGEAEWSDSALEDVAETVDSTSSGNSSGAEDAEATQIAIKLATVSPSAGVIAAFIEVELAAGRYLEALDIPQSHSPIAALRRAPGVPEDVKRIVRQLASLRNAAAHGKSDIELESALEYIRVATDFAQVLGRMAPR